MNKKKKTIKLFIAVVAAVVLCTPILQGCKKKSPVETKKPQTEASPLVKPQEQQVQAAVEDDVQGKGYIYQPRDRRDPFMPLIVPKQKTEKLTSIGGGLGTLESYDISDFALLAIAKKGKKYYALLVTPDNRSFTVNRGTSIGLNKGRVETITDNRVVLIEYSKDFRGDSRPKQITLELLED